MPSYPYWLANRPRRPNQDLVVTDEYTGEVATRVALADRAAIDEVNDSPFGLQAGVFTRDLYKAQRAWDRLEVGAVLINEAPSWRADHMPCGGVKGSGLGREGIRFAIEAMTEIRLLVLRTP